MTNDKYILRYLPLFYKDLEEKIVYIAETLQNSKAAQEHHWMRLKRQY